MTDEDLLEAREPLGMVELVEDLGSASKAGARLQRFRFPPQDHAARVGRRVDDPRVQAPVGTVREIDELGGTVTLYRTATELARGIPSSLVPFDLVSTGVIEDSLLRIGRRAVELRAGQGNGQRIGDPGPIDRAGRELLLRRSPRILGSAPGSPLRSDHETALVAATRLALHLDGSTLAIQGPPGSGKTYTGACTILALVAAGRTVGVTGNTHKVIGNVLDEVHRAARAAGLREEAISIGQKPGPDEPPTCTNARDLSRWDGAKIAAALAGRDLDVVGGTAWLWSTAAMAGSVDVLIVDEAGQMSLANTIAVSPAARSLVLLGDPQQLDQPLKGSHPPGAERSALAHLLAGYPGQPPHATMPPERGLFIEKTWRLHPDVCAFTSEVFYESKLTPEAGRERQSVRGVPPETRPGEPPLRGAGIRWLPVEHAANAVDSPEEATEIARLLGELFSPATDAHWTNVDGVEAPLRQDDVVVVAPFNAHVDRISAALRSVGLGGVRVGTVDRFQGQEAPLSIYAMGSSSPEDAPRGMEFLYSLNRLNVATSRARCIAAVVASPALVRVACQTPRQMRLANALCRLVEMSSPVA